MSTAERGHARRGAHSEQLCLGESRYSTLNGRRSPHNGCSEGPTVRSQRIPHTHCQLEGTSDIGHRYDAAPKPSTYYDYTRYLDDTRAHVGVREPSLQGNVYTSRSVGPHADVEVWNSYRSSAKISVRRTSAHLTNRACDAHTHRCDRRVALRSRTSRSSWNPSTNGSCTRVVRSPVRRRASLTRYGRGRGLDLHTPTSGGRVGMRRRCVKASHAGVCVPHPPASMMEKERIRGWEGEAANLVEKYLYGRLHVRGSESVRILEGGASEFFGAQSLASRHGIVCAYKGQLCYG